MLRCGLLGETLGHSYSPMIHHALGEYDYRLFEIPKEDLDAFLRSDCWDGLNVTIPYKRDVMAFLDSVSPEAEAIGAVNCIRRTADGRLAGHNTDVIGLRAALNELLGAAQPVQALVFGTGGASQAVQYALAERDIPFALVSREAAKGNYTYDDLPCEAVEASRLIVNASPVGTYPNVDAAPRIPYAYVTPEHYLLDLVYNPPLTQFLDYGRQRGAHILNGRTMFVGQAEASWRIWNA